MEAAERLAIRPDGFWPTDEKNADAPHPIDLLRPLDERPSGRVPDETNKSASFHLIALSPNGSNVSSVGRLTAKCISNWTLRDSELGQSRRCGDVRSWRKAVTRRANVQ
jgi:hypothetical protein